MTSGDMPLIVKSCVVNIEENGLDMEGIFRIPGPSQTVDDLRKAFEDGEYLSLKMSSVALFMHGCSLGLFVGVNPLMSGSVKRNKTDIAAIASVLKQYFRELEDPLFPQQRYSHFIECASM